MTRTRSLLLLSAVALLAAGVLAWSLAPTGGSDARTAYAAPTMPAMRVDEAREGLFLLLPALLLQVYDAFSRTGEAEIYDTLAVAAAGDALEALYLERAGAMVGGGLAGQDQQIHELRLIRANAQQSGETFAVDAAWEVIGTVGHTEHMHVRGNTYRAELAIAPVDGAWRITDFTLRDVDRQTAGETFAVDPETGRPLADDGAAREGDGT